MLYLVKEVELAVRHLLDQIVGTAELTSLQYTALTVLERQPRVTAAALARNSFVRAQTMAQMISYLADRGLVRREADIANRKHFLLSLTDEGKRVVDSLRGPVASLEASMLQALNDDDKGRLRSSLQECRIALEAIRRG
ncbi:MarR family transcriptional regulator [Subtercola boreus]|uniref:MarR family transcriptional regulator n=2 Tax=Subtercola boreus TaxID=120213 RepID=A0A3E0VMI0_9MICO|nr:MarR family transcriptional regulator [Subtercola boreus]